MIPSERFFADAAGMTRGEKAWLAWRLLREQGLTTPWHVFAEALPQCLRSQVTPVGCPTGKSHQLTFNDESVVETDAEGMSPKIKTMRQCGTDVFLAEWRAAKGVKPGA